MKVICTTHENFSGIAVVDDTTPDIGEIVTVVDEQICKGIDCYMFEEYGAWLYDKRNYSPLSNIDEIELVNQLPEKQLQSCGG